jgi:hypothetical protein
MWAGDAIEGSSYPSDLKISMRAIRGWTSLKSIWERTLSRSSKYEKLSTPTDIKSKLSFSEDRELLSELGDFEPFRNFLDSLCFLCGEWRPAINVDYLLTFSFWYLPNYLFSFAVEGNAPSIRILLVFCLEPIYMGCAIYSAIPFKVTNFCDSAISKSIFYGVTVGRGDRRRAF